jgi:hypothetical protein
MLFALRPRTLLVARRSAPLLAAVVLAALPGTADAGVPKLSVRVDQAGDRPVSFFTVGGRPGRRSSAGRIVVTNRDRRPVVVDVDPVGAVTAANLGSAYRLRGTGGSGPARWTRLSARKLTIPAGGEAAVGVAVRVPRRVEPGEYLSGVGIEARGQREPPSGKSKVAVSSAQRYVIGLQVNLRGPRERLIRLTGARVEWQPSGLTFLVAARNPGNAILKEVEGQIRINREDGPRVLSEEVGPGTFVTGTRIEIPALARSEEPKTGAEYRVRAELRYRGGVAKLDEVVTFGKREAQVQESFGRSDADGLPWWLWALVSAGLAVALAAGARLARRRLGRPLRPEPAMELLRRELERTAESGQPVSVALVAPVPALASDRAVGAHRMRSRLRSSDRLADLGEAGLLVIAPETGARGAAGLAEDLERLLREAPGFGSARVGTATAEEPASPADLIAHARLALRSPVSPRTPSG